mmetsp:Transcript_9912/g.26940  ORF Transcript_9912/g.26940 Transcript_9912/m.26940 type:complete len:369 (-) Transcript_9912:67-1173(-)
MTANTGASAAAPAPARPLLLSLLPPRLAGVSGAIWLLFGTVPASKNVPGVACCPSMPTCEPTVEMRRGVADAGMPASSPCSVTWSSANSICSSSSSSPSTKCPVPKPPCCSCHSCCFFSRDRSTATSTVSWHSRRVTRTGRCCPMRCTRATACCSMAGSSEMSIMNTWFARTSVRPAAPCCSDSRKTLTFGSFLKRATASRALPFARRRVWLSDTCPKPLTFNARPTSFSASGNWLNTRDFSSGACSRRSSSRRSRASILVIQLPRTFTCTTPLPSGGSSSGLWRPAAAALARVATARNTWLTFTSRRHIGQFGLWARRTVLVQSSQKKWPHSNTISAAESSNTARQITHSTLSSSSASGSPTLGTCC